MAVIDALTVELFVTGTDHKEYVHPTVSDTQNRRHRVVEAISGANFSIDINLSDTFIFLGNVLTCKLTIDGIESRRVQYSHRPIPAGTQRHETIDEIQDGDRVHTLMFQPLGVEQVSNISVEIKHGIRGPPSPSPSTDFHPEDLETMGISSKVTVGPGVVRGSPGATMVDYVGGEEDVYYFEFECCSRETLKVRGIVQEEEQRSDQSFSGN